MNVVHPKVIASTAGALGGGSIGDALGTVITWLLSMHGIQVPDEVAAAFGVILGTATALAAGYIAPNPQSAPDAGQKAN